MAMDYKQIVENKRQEMVDLLLASIESNPERWEKGWIGIDAQYNAVTGKTYNGLNALFLDVIAEGKGYKDTRWVTFKQAKDLGASIKVGEKASNVFYWSRYDKKTKQPFEEETVEGMTYDEREDYIRENVRPVLKFYQVYNVDQCKNFPENTRQNNMSDEEQAKLNNRIETIIKNSSVPIIYDGKAYYSPHKDNIHLPTVQSFKSMQDYYATALHEIAHSTGHPRRLRREGVERFGSESYAIEELRAELASVFMQAELGINLKGAEIANHGSYLKFWLSAVLKDKNVFFRAAVDAGKISDYIKANYLEKAEEKENTKENQVQNDTLKAKENAEAKAIEEDRAYVVIEWSEHSRFKDNTVLTFAEADKILQSLNSEAKSDEEYYKTKLHICCPIENNVGDWYNDCRFDIGSEANGGILRHIGDFASTSWISESERIEIEKFINDVKAHIEPKAEISVREFYRNYMDVQEQNSEAIYFKRVGDFYEVLGDNAKVASEELGLMLTGRDVGLEERVPMCGVPYHAIDMYIDKLRNKYDVVVENDKEDVKLPKHIEENISDWYRTHYQEDEISAQLLKGKTFKNLQQAIDLGSDIYKDIIGVSDSLVRERLFGRLAEIQGLKYEDVYNSWAKDSSTENFQSSMSFNQNGMEYEIKYQGNNRGLSTSELPSDVRDAALWLIKNGYQNDPRVQSAFYNRLTSVMLDDYEAEKNDNERIKKVYQRLSNREVEQVKQARQVELVLPLENKMREYGKSTMFKMPKGGEYSRFVFLVPTRMVQAKGDKARILVPSNFEFTLKDDGREIKLTSEELRTSIDGKEIGKIAQRTSPSKRNVMRLEALRGNAPKEMKDMPNWCVYRTKWNDEKGKKDKFVLSVHDGKWARINDRNTWADFETAYKYAFENNCEGLSFALDGSGITCIDLDKCITKDGELNDVASKLVPELSDTYCECSASGNGLHFFLIDDILAKDTFANRANTPGGGEIEVYDTARFISMTGDVYGKSKQSDKSGKLSKCPVQTMSWLRTALGPKNKISTAQRSLERPTTDFRYQSDSEVLARIRRSKKAEQFDTLYFGGDVTADKSRDDLIMLNTLAFFTDCNEDQMRSIFEGSARFRPETKTSAYVTRSIRKACDSLTVRFGQNQTSMPGKAEI